MYSSSHDILPIQKYFFTENIPGMLIAFITMRKTVRTPVVRGLYQIGPTMTYIDYFILVPNLLFHLTVLQVQWENALLTTLKRH